MSAQWSNVVIRDPRNSQALDTRFVRNLRDWREVKFWRVGGRGVGEIAGVGAGDMYLTRAVFCFCVSLPLSLC